MRRANATTDPGVLFSERKARCCRSALDAGTGYALACWSRRSRGTGGLRRADPPKAGARRCSCRCSTRGLRGAKRSRGRPIFSSTHVTPPRRDRVSRGCAAGENGVRGIARSARTVSTCIRRSCRGSHPGLRSSALRCPAGRHLGSGPARADSRRPRYRVKADADLHRVSRHQRRVQRRSASVPPEPRPQRGIGEASRANARQGCAARCHWTTFALRAPVQFAHWGGPAVLIGTTFALRAAVQFAPWAAPRCSCCLLNAASTALLRVNERARRPSAVFSAGVADHAITFVGFSAGLPRAPCRRGSPPAARPSTCPTRQLVAARDHALDLIAVGMDDDGRAVDRNDASSPALSTAPTVSRFGSEMPAESLRRTTNWFGVAGGGDEQDVRRARHRLRQRFLLRVEVFARDRLALIRRRAEAAELEVLLEALTLPPSSC